VTASSARTLHPGGYAPGNTAFRLIVFDWDGTLMDSEARIVDAMRRALVETGLEVPPRERLRAVIGLGLMEAVAALLPREDRTTHARVADRYRTHYLAADGVPTPLFPGAREAVETLHRRGHRLAVATGKSRRGLARSLDESGLGGLFQATRCADETCSKPHPRMLLELMEACAVGPEETLMVGDTEFDLEMACRAGVASVGVTWGVHPPERLRRQAPLTILDSLEALPRWLAAQRRAAA